MRRVGIFTIIGIACVLAARPAAAQPRGYAFGTGGYGSVWGDEGSLGKGGVVGGGGGFAITGHLAVEGAVTASRHERAGFIAWEGEPRAVTARAVYRFGRSDSSARPFVAGGIGYFRYPGTVTETRFDSPGAPPHIVSRDWLVSGRAFDAGGGVEVNLTPRLFLRPEFWLTLGGGNHAPSAAEPSYVLPRVAVSAGVRF